MKVIRQIHRMSKHFFKKILIPGSIINDFYYSLLCQSQLFSSHLNFQADGQVSMLQRVEGDRFHERSDCTKYLIIY